METIEQRVLTIADISAGLGWELDKCFPQPGDILVTTKDDRYIFRSITEYRVEGVSKNE